MFLRKKKRVLELIDTMSEMLVVFSQINNPSTFIPDCLAAIDAVYSQVIKEETLPYITLDIIEDLKKSFINLMQGVLDIDEQSISFINGEILKLRSTFHEEVETKLNIVFFPYKASMWDSLETIYKAAELDEDSVVHVVPIPYYQLTQDEVIPTYEGERFPVDIPITHFNEYNLVEEEPDIIFIHNIYDNYNTLTRVYEQYFTSNLKQYTDMLVYVPYYTASFIPYKKDEGFYPYNIPSLKNVDKVIYVNENEMELAIKEGISPEKILVLGSPKLDAMVQTLNSTFILPETWGNKINENKTVYLLNTGCLHFANNPYLAMEEIVNILNVPRFIKDSVVIWRPHPLTKTSIKKYNPSMYNYFLKLTEEYIKGDNNLYPGVILDEEDDYLPSLMAADVLISKDSSILRSYLLTEKKVLYWDEGIPKESLIPIDSFYYAFNRNEPWYELVKKFSKGEDPLAENRRGLASRVYVNADGTSGVSIFHSIKKTVLCESNLELEKR